MRTIKEIKELDSITQIGDKYYFTRPINYKYRSLKERIKEAYFVFIGKYDALKWDEQ